VTKQSADIRFSNIDPVEQLRRYLARQRDFERAGGNFRYADTRILETEGARATDPFRGAFGDDGWHKKLARKAGFDSRELLRKLEKAERRITARDAAATENYLEKYFGSPDNDARLSLPNLARFVDVNAEQARPWFDLLREHIYKLPSGAKVKDIDTKISRLCLRELIPHQQ
jgi:hypothetical protein